MKNINLIPITVLFTLFLVAFCGSVMARSGPHACGAVYTMSNAADGNEVLLYDRFGDGQLVFSGSFPTGGKGTGGGLGNQRGLVMSRNQKWLLTVNAGSNEISVFRIGPFGLVLTDTVASNGTMPVSVTIHKRLVYVLHAGGGAGATDNITGFTLTPAGSLLPLPSSTRPLSDTSTGPAQIAFASDGRVLVVTEKATNIIDTYLVGADGLANGPFVHASAGETPFGFSFGKRNQLFVSEAFGAQPDAGAVSSYEVLPNGDLIVIDPSVPNTETAPCWLVVTKNGRFAYTTNTPSDSLSGYGINVDGTLSLLDADGRTGETGPGANPIDMDLSNGDRYLYTLNGGNGSIGAFGVFHDGSLENIQTVPGIPVGANGLAAR
jgi:6-phosphogluconolactonase (cycloisomerase 2 family)